MRLGGQLLRGDETAVLGRNETRSYYACLVEQVKKR